MGDIAQIYEEARRAGIDLELLDSNLALPVKERWRLHDEAVNLAEALRGGLISHNAKSHPTAGTAR